MGFERRTQVILASLLVLLLAGCAPAFRPVRNPAQRLDLYGFSILPPQGSGWLRDESGSGAGRVMFGKALARGPLPTLIAIASAAIPPEISANDADELRQALERLTWERFRVVQGRYFLKQYDPAVDRSLAAECVRYDQLQEERNNPSPALRGKDLEIRVWGFDCLHPANRRLMIKVYCSLRTELGSAFVLDAGTQQEAEGFLRSLMFRALP